MKRFIAMAVCAVMLFGTLACFGNATKIVPVETYTLGDVNCDGAVNAKDCLVLRKNLAEVEVECEFSSDAADILADASITSGDLLLLRKSLAGIVELSDYETDHTVQRVTIGGNDLSEYVIVIPEWADSEQNINYSAKELRNYVEDACGIWLEIVNEAPEGKRAIRFVDVEEGSPMEEKLEWENYIYEVVNGDLNIYGTYRGNMYAVYDILELYFGYRFYHNDYIWEYTRRCVDIPEGTYEYCELALDFRHCSAGFGGTYADVHYLPRHLNGTQIYRYESSLKYGTLTGPRFINAHSYGYYWRMANGFVNWDTAGVDPSLDAKLYYEKYQSGFQQNELNWNPCFTSDEDYELLFRGLLETIRMIRGRGQIFYPGITSMSFSICDNPTPCTCIDCRKISTNEYFKKDNVYGLGAGGAGCCVYLANRAAKDIVAYYEGRAASEELPYEPDDPNDPYGFSTYYDTTWAHGLPIEDAYPDLKIYTILYDHSAPTAILPEENVIIMYCVNSCNNHYLGSEECKDCYNNLAYKPYDDYFAMKAWGEACKAQGAEMWYWYYPVNYNMKLFDTPNIFNLYYDYIKLVEDCCVTGVYYEGSGTGYLTETLKSHMASIMAVNIKYDEEGNLTYMSFDEYVEAMKEFIYLYYGDGYEEIYQYIVLWHEVGDAAPCFVNNFDRPGDMYDYELCGQYYEEMRGYLTAALEKTADSKQALRIKYLLASCDFMGLSANYNEWCKNGTNKEVYMQRYEEMHKFLLETGYVIYGGDYYKTPTTVDYETNPMVTFYEFGSWRATNEDTWGYEENMYGWGFAGVIS